VSDTEEDDYPTTINHHSAIWRRKKSVLIQHTTELRRSLRKDCC